MSNLQHVKMPMSNLQSIVNPLFVYDFLSPTLCDELIIDAENIGFENGVTGTSNQTELRKSSVCWLNDIEKHKKIYNTMTTSIQNAADFYGFEISGIEAIQIAKYEVGQYYNWHLDIGNIPKLSFRKISMTVELCNPHEYDGGKLEFDFMTDEFERSKGLAFAFPSFLRHRVTPVTRGTRYSIVAWASGPRFK